MRIPTAGVLRAHTGEVLCAAVSPCGELVASGSSRGEILVWGLETRRVVFRLPPECCHGDKGILQVAWLPEGYHKQVAAARTRSTPTEGGGGGGGGNPNTTRGVPPGAEWLTMGRDGCIRFWGVREVDAGGDSNSSGDGGGDGVRGGKGTRRIRLSHILRNGGGAAGHSSVNSTNPSAPAAAPRLPPASADYGDFAFIARPTQDTTFRWGAGTYEVYCVATIFHSSFSFCKFALRATGGSGGGDDGEATGVLLVPSDVEEMVRVYQLWGPAVAPADASPEDVWERDVPFAWRRVRMEGVPCAGGMKKADNPMMTEILEHAAREQRVLAGERVEPSDGDETAGASPTPSLPLQQRHSPSLSVADIFLADLPPRCGGELLKSGTPMACDGIFVAAATAPANPGKAEGTPPPPPHSFVCGVGYESGHVLVHVLPCAGVASTAELSSPPPPPLQLAMKPHKEVVLSLAFASKGKGKLLVATGGADDVISVHGLQITDVRAPVLTPLHTISLVKPGTAALAFHPLNARLLCAGCWDARARVIDVKTGSQLAALEEHEKTISACVWVRAPGGRGAVLLTAGNDSLVAIWDVYAGGV